MEQTDTVRAAATEKRSMGEEQEKWYLEDSEVNKVLQYLAPWIVKTNGVESIGAWESTLASKMMMKLLELWLTPRNRKHVEDMLVYYHPLDRAAMAYALVVYVLTGGRLHFKNGVAQQHYKIVCKMLRGDIPELMFTGHMKYMLRRYGRKQGKVNSEK